MDPHLPGPPRRRCRRRTAGAWDSDRASPSSARRRTKAAPSTWSGATAITFHGRKFDTGTKVADPVTDLDQDASWCMNFIRLHVHWTDLEPTAPKHNPDGTWRAPADADSFTREDVNRYQRLAREFYPKVAKLVSGILRGTP